MTKNWIPLVASSNPTGGSSGLWCDLGCCSRTVVVIKLRRTSAFIFVTTLATGTFARLKLNKYLVFILYSFSRYAPSLAKHKWCKLVLPKYYPYCDHTLVQVSLPIYLPIYGNLSASCPTQNRVCNAYAGYNLTLLQDPLFLYNASTLQLAYLPAFVSSLYVQTLCAVAGLHLVDQAIQASTNRYSIGVIPCYEQVGVFLATIQLDMGGLLAKAPNPAHDFAGVLESALYFADSTVVTSRHDFFSRCWLFAGNGRASGNYCAAHAHTYARTFSPPTTLPRLPALAPPGEDSSSDCI